MQQLVIETNNLSKKYRTKAVLHHIDMKVPKGAIYGFIGLNGAGKSTCLRVLTGLTEPSSGSIQLFESTTKDKLSESRKRMGMMIEEPALYPYMTAEQNLEIIRKMRGIPGKDRITETLKRVGLSHTGKKKIKAFSLGMKQRLGIAIALLSNPELLILDEPINGLDPVAVVEMRQLLQKLNLEYGVTIVISSHILTEVHQIATHYGIIHEGKLIEQCTKEEVDEKCQSYIYLRVDQVDKAVTIIEEVLQTKQLHVLENGAIKLYDYITEPSTVSKTLFEHGIMIDEISPKHDTLEGYFTRLVKEESV